MISKEEGNKTAKARQADTSERYLAFQLDTEQYAIPLLQVKEVIEMTEPTPIPQTPPSFKGIINLRGQVISVIDLRSKLQLKEVEYGPKTAIIILDLGPSLSIGVVVDRINSVVAFSAEHVSPAPEFQTGRERYITGIARREMRITLIMDVRAALSLEEFESALKNTQQMN